MNSDLNVCGKCIGYGYGESSILHHDDCPMNNKQKKEMNRVIENIDNGKKCAKCNSVGGEKGKLLMCSGCKCTFYCGSSCQKEDWKRHKKECCNNLEKSEESIDEYCIEHYKKDYKKIKKSGEQKTFMMNFYEKFWRDQGEIYLLDRAHKEAKEEMKIDKLF